MFSLYKAVQIITWEDKSVFWFCGTKRQKCFQKVLSQVPYIIHHFWITYHISKGTVDYITLFYLVWQQQVPFRDFIYLNSCGYITCIKKKLESTDRFFFYKRWLNFNILSNLKSDNPYICKHLQNGADQSSVIRVAGEKEI